MSALADVAVADPVAVGDLHALGLSKMARDLYVMLRKWGSRARQRAEGPPPRWTMEALAARLKRSPSRVRRALNELRAEGLLLRYRCGETWVLIPLGWTEDDALGLLERDARWFAETGGLVLVAGNDSQQGRVFDLGDWIAELSDPELGSVAFAPAYRPRLIEDRAQGGKGWRAVTLARVRELLSAGGGEEEGCTPSCPPATHQESPPSCPPGQPRIKGASSTKMLKDPGRTAAAIASLRETTPKAAAPSTPEPVHPLRTAAPQPSLEGRAALERLALDRTARERAAELAHRAGVDPLDLASALADRWGRRGRPRNPSSAVMGLGSPSRDAERHALIEAAAGFRAERLGLPARTPAGPSPIDPPAPFADLEDPAALFESCSDAYAWTASDCWRIWSWLRSHGGLSAAGFEAVFDWIESRAEKKPECRNAADPTLAAGAVLLRLLGTDVHLDLVREFGLELQQVAA